MLRGPQNTTRHLQGDQGVSKAEFIREGKSQRLEEPMWRVCRPLFYCPQTQPSRKL